jgi:dolichol-phosphate mannosyltransferase
MIYYVIAAYNEERDLPGLLAALGRWQGGEAYRIIIVDDGSTDGTAQLLKDACSRLPLTVIAHEHNRGLGRALGTGFSAAARLIGQEDVVVTMDADRTHPVSLVPAMADMIMKDGCDIVIASRFMPGGKQCGLPAYRRFLSSCARNAFSVVYPIPGVRDYTSGFRAYSGRLVRDLVSSYGERLVEENGFAATAEILFKAASRAGKIAEIPLVLHYENKAGRSKMNVVRTLGRYLWLLKKLRAMNGAR